jgi:carbamate kinase
LCGAPLDAGRGTQGQIGYLLAQALNDAFPGVAAGGVAVIVTRNGSGGRPGLRLPTSPSAPL